MDSYLLVEEGELDPLPSSRLKGNLYLLAHGAQGARLLRAIRDQYCGDPLIGNTLEVALGALDSIEAAATLLSPRELGISCMAAITSVPNQLSLVGAGDCKAFLDERRRGNPQALLAPRYPHKRLAMESPAVIERAHRTMGPGDRIVLCCGPLAQAIGVKELTAVLSSIPDSYPQEVAEQLASVAKETGGGAAVVVSCRTASPEAFALAEPHTPKAGGTVYPDARHSVLGKARGKLPLAWLLAVFVIVMVGSAVTDSLGKYISLPAFSIPWDSVLSQADVNKDLLGRIEDLWSKGQKGDVQAWRDAVALLQELQNAQPADLGIAERLKEAVLNRQFAEAMAEVAVHWGTGETSARRVEAWAKAVEVLDGLQPRMAGASFLKPVLEKLYAARINYGKALEAAGRLAEARATYEKARTLDPARPEATDALRRLR